MKTKLLILAPGALWSWQKFVVRAPLLSFSCHSLSLTLLSVLHYYPSLACYSHPALPVSLPSELSLSAEHQGLYKDSEVESNAQTFWSKGDFVPLKMSKDPKDLSISSRSRNWENIFLIIGFYQLTIKTHVWLGG